VTAVIERLGHADERTPVRVSATTHVLHGRCERELERMMHYLANLKVALEAASQRRNATKERRIVSRIERAQARANLLKLDLGRLKVHLFVDENHGKRYDIDRWLFDVMEHLSESGELGDARICLQRARWVVGQLPLGNMDPSRIPTLETRVSRLERKLMVTAWDGLIHLYWFGVLQLEDEVVVHP